jgi:hypothetical protein
MGNPFMAADRRNPERTPSQADPDGALERLLQRRHLKFRDGDVIITRQAGGLRAESRAVYHLHVHGSGPLPDRFASFEHAAAKGEDLATKHKVRLFYVEHKNDSPALLKDARTS